MKYSTQQKKQTSHSEKTPEWPNPSFDHAKPSKWTINYDGKGNLQSTYYQNYL